VRLLVLTHRLSDPSFRLRWGQLFPLLAEMGVEGRAEEIPANGRRAVFARATDADVTVLHRRLLGARNFRALRGYAKRLVYDFDDALCYRPHAPHRSKNRERRFFRAVAGADMVFAGNRVLAGIARIARPRVRVIPTTVDPAHYAFDGAKAEHFTAVWIGQRWTLPHLQTALPALLAAGVAVRVVADEAPDGAEFVPWSLEGEAAALGSAHVGLMPLPDDPFARGKCGFKLLQYFAAGLPAVASPVGVNRALASGGALLARRPEEWVSAVLRLRDDRALRERMGNGARAFVARRYAAEHLAARLSRLLQSGS
jgi:glycosyltransferase involved in cell wall biosynthesis